MPISTAYSYSKGFTLSSLLFVIINLLSHSTCQANDVYEDDSLYSESPSRSEQAVHELLLEGEKAIRRSFEFPKDTLDEPQAIFGIDVSHHNGDIKWDKIPNNNIVFAIAKASEGTTISDKQFKGHWEEIKKHKDAAMQTKKPRFFRGAYHFFTPSDPEQQAKKFIEQVGNLEPGDLPPTLDLEWTSFKNDRWKAYSGEEIARRALIWLQSIEKHYGRKPLIYTNAGWWNERGISNQELAKYPLWIANYSSKAIKMAKPNKLPSKFNNWLLWQFTDIGYFKDNSNVKFDVDRMNGGIQEIYKLANVSEEQVASSTNPTNPVTPSVPKNCTFDTLNNAIVTEGKHKVALVVGVSDFLAEKDGLISNLRYSVNDANDFAKLLISDYGYPAENVCLLLNQDATIANVRKYFQKMASLIEKKTDKPSEDQDVAIFYASSHGSQVINNPIDQAGTKDHEISGYDSTLVLYDSFVDKNWDLVDDEMYDLIGGLLDKTPNVAVIIDACDSGSLSKGEGRVKSVSIRPPGFQEGKPFSYQKTEKDIQNHLIYLGAAQDGQSAYELGAPLEHGVFTDALLRLSKPVSNKPLTYGKLKNQIARDLQFNKREQIPVLSGPDEQIAFGTEKRTRPGNMLTVSDVTSSQIHLTGIPLPGLGKGAIFKVFDSNISAEDSRKSDLAKALLKVTQNTEGDALAEVIGNTNSDSNKIAVGDIAVMIQPSESYQALRIRLKPEDEPYGLPNSLHNMIIQKIEGMSNDSFGSISIINEEPEYSVELLPNENLAIPNGEQTSQIIIRGIGSNRDVIIPKDNIEDITANTIVNKLDSLNKLKKFSNLTSYSNGEFTDDKTLKVDIIKSDKALPDKQVKFIKDHYDINCKDPASLSPKADQDNLSYKLPICMTYYVKIKYNSPPAITAPPLYIGLITISSEGDLDSYPKTVTDARLEPGQEVLFPDDGFSLAAFPPLGEEDIFLAIGTQDKREWKDISQSARGTLRVSVDKPLEASLKAWTLTKIPTQVFVPEN